METIIDQYEKIVDYEYIHNLYEISKPLCHKSIVHINSTIYGGGVAEILNDLIIIMNELGIKTEWHQIKGSIEFFQTTKKLHNTLQGEETELTDHEKRVYLDNNRKNSIYNHVEDTDCVIIHDPQPLSLIQFYEKRQPWIWRCHIDISNKFNPTWKFLKNFIHRYDGIVVSMEKYKQKLNLPQYIINPSINPFNNKNRMLNQTEIESLLNDFNIPNNKPIISQISRFDKWKDPLGVIRAFKIIKKEFDCRLVLLGNMAQDDPEGFEIYNKILQYVKDDPDINIITAENSLLVNALQRVSKVVIQKSLREGFGLTVTEALWKGTPVIGGDVGGIPLQIIDGETGYLVNNIEECANRVLKLLKNPNLAEDMGKKGKEYVKEHFLMLRHLEDYVKILKKYVINYKI
ncbi:MAG: glycosyltransferase [Candidatus Lokiarchaeota archaeon]|nr:glycosyltransferase [Candidatus Lokiarchaeota archaeon]